MGFNLSNFNRIGTPLLAVLATTYVIMETLRPLRQHKAPRRQRWKTNAGVALVGLTGLKLALLPGLVVCAKASQKHNIGLLHHVKCPTWLKLMLSFLLLDYGNYAWHVLNHRYSFLWRLHQVHHLDVDLDVTTAWRFHLGEILASVISRGGVVTVTGVKPAHVLQYELFYEAATAFHHSNWRLPFRLEKILTRILVTPRMHGIHHSICEKESNSNFAVIFSIWDRLHQSMCLNVPQQSIIVGHPAYLDAQEQTVAFLLALPFSPTRLWQQPNSCKANRQIINSPFSLVP